MDFTPSALLYLGGLRWDGGSGIAVDGEGNAYVTGSTHSPDFPVANPLQPFYGGGYSDAFVTKLNATGSALLFSTYLGGNGHDGGSGIVVDGSGNVYIAGSTFSFNLPVVNPLQPGYRGGRDAFVAKISDGPSAAPSRR